MDPQKAAVVRIFQDELKRVESEKKELKLRVAALESQLARAQAEPPAPRTSEAESLYTRFIARQLGLGGIKQPTLFTSNFPAPYQAQIESVLVQVN